MVTDLMGRKGYSVVRKAGAIRWIPGLSQWFSGRFAECLNERGPSRRMLLVRGGWSKSQTGFRDDFYERLGMSVHLTFRGK